MRQKKKKESISEQIGKKGGEVKREFYSRIGNVKRNSRIKKDK